MGAKKSRISVNVTDHILIAALSVLICTGITGCAEDKTAEKFVTHVIETAVRPWDADALYGMSAEQFKSAASKEDVEGMFTFYSALGDLKSYDTPNGQVREETLPDGTKAAVGAFHVPAEFDKDKATINVIVIRTDAGWAVYGFKINSNYVMNIIDAQKREPELDM